MNTCSVAIMEMENREHYANWKFKYLLVNCAFKDAGIERVDGRSTLVQTQLMTREMGFMLYIVMESHDPYKQWPYLQRLVPYFEDWDAVFSILAAIYLMIQEEDVKKDLEVVKGYFDKCVSGSWKWLMKDYPLN